MGCASLRLAATGLLVLAGLAAGAPSALAQASPEVLGRWPYGRSLAVAVDGQHVFFGRGATLQVVDVTDPSTPRADGEAGVTIYRRWGWVAGGEREPAERPRLPTIAGAALQ